MAGIPGTSLEDIVETFASTKEKMESKGERNNNKRASSRTSYGYPQRASSRTSYGYPQRASSRTSYGYPQRASSRTSYGYPQRASSQTSYVYPQISCHALRGSRVSLSFFFLKTPEDRRFIEVLEFGLNNILLD